jgi:GxxExxY protein
MSEPVVGKRNAAPQPFEDVTYNVIGCAMRVHNKLGPGLKEAAYQNALSLEMEATGLSFEAEHQVEVMVDGSSIGLPFLDHLVEGRVVVEEKAISHLLTQEEVAQVITYLCATGLTVGLLLNFGRKQLQYKRILPPKNVSRWRERIQRYVWNPNDARDTNAGQGRAVSANPL